MNKHYRGFLFVIFSIVISMMMGCSVLGEITTPQIESINALKQEAATIATAQAESLSTLQGAVSEQAILIEQVQQDIQAVATAVVDQVVTPMPEAEELLISGVGLNWKDTETENENLLDFAADEMYYFDERNNLLTAWGANTGRVLFIWKQATSTDPENSLTDIEGNLYYSETLLDNYLPDIVEANIQFVSLQNLLYLSGGTHGNPGILYHGEPQIIIEPSVRISEEASLLETLEATLGIEQIAHLLILIEQKESTNGEDLQKVLLTLETPVDGPDDNDPSCGQYCVQCYNGICEYVCWACSLVQ